MSIAYHVQKCLLTSLYSLYILHVLVTFRLRNTAEPHYVEVVGTQTNTST